LEWEHRQRDELLAQFFELMIARMIDVATAIAEKSVATAENHAARAALRAALSVAWIRFQSRSRIHA
jgi:hypothetical protein